ncbi:MAG TPA: DUF4440 domain-containing protein [Pyrinomonadaceae bacterium]|nr:DUF4440 domain-containing protein [Pyrinomonadaceae bacterium]
MKRCSTCNRTYTDPNLSFCIDDGTPLTTVDADDDATVVTPRGNAVAYQPPRPYVPEPAEVKRRRAWPWVVGIFGAFILGILVIAIAAAFLVPRMIRRLEQDSGRPVENETSNANSNSTTSEPNNANVNAAEPVNNTPPPADHAQVLTQLTEIENEWTVANLNADKKKLDRILADDFVAQGTEGELQSKADYIREIERDTQVDKWEFDDLKLTLTGDRATLTGTITYFFRDRTMTFDFTDKFVWRNGRWQATGAEIKQKETTDVNYH